MTESRDLSAVFKTLQEEALPSLGVNDPLYSRIIASRLLIERLGETDANYWWDSQILGEFGRDALAEAVPRTSTRAQIELATKTGQKVEGERIDDQSVSLFDLGPFIESQIEHELEQINGGADLNILEHYSNEITNKGWTDSIVLETDPIASKSDTAFELGTVAMTDLKNKDVLGDVVDQLVHGYGESTANNLRVPYFRVNQ